MTGDFDSKDLKGFLHQRRIRFDYQMKVRTGMGDEHARIPNQSKPVKGPAELVSHSLEEFCAIIVSCKELYCLTTGTATLAAALRKPAKVLYGIHHDPIYRHSPIHEYILVPKRTLSFVERQLCRLRNLPRRLRRSTSIT